MYANFLQIKNVRLPRARALCVFAWKLHRVLNKFGITKFDPLGVKFNPNEHSALLEVESNDHAEGHVAVVLKCGFRIKDRVLRVADVGVAKKTQS